MIKIAFFIGSLVSGGKERRFVELLTYLANDNKYDILVLTTSSEMHFPQFEKLGIPVKQVRKNRKMFGVNLPFQLFKILREFDADIVHTWGRIQTLYSLPAKALLRFRLINGQITNASRVNSAWERMIDFINFALSDQIVANSEAGLNAYTPPKSKSLVIKNGMNFSRFENLGDIESIKQKFRITTPFTIVMVATFSENKDYRRFLDVAKELLEIRDDVSFLAVGTYHKNRKELYEEFQQRINGNPKIMMTGVIHDVESLVHACDIGVLFTNNNVHGEGISNSVLEYMALGKPVMANDSGGTKEIIQHKLNGFLATNETSQNLALVLNDWLKNKTIRDKFGQNAKSLVYSEFSMEKMGIAFDKLYQKLVPNRLPK
jgi:glycosyltransferase involved in cell wall biosynthesis